MLMEKLPGITAKPPGQLPSPVGGGQRFDPCMYRPKNEGPEKMQGRQCYKHVSHGPKFSPSSHVIAPGWGLWC